MSMKVTHALALSALAFAFAVPAQAADGYWSSRDGTIITSSKTGKCFKTRYWKPENATPKCKEKATAAAMK
jgi:hypothetical protein